MLFTESTTTFTYFSTLFVPFDRSLVTTITIPLFLTRKVPWRIGLRKTPSQSRVRILSTWSRNHQNENIWQQVLEGGVLWTDRWAPCMKVKAIKLWTKSSRCHLRPIRLRCNLWREDNRFGGLEDLGAHFDSVSVSVCGGGGGGFEWVEFNFSAWVRKHSTKNINTFSLRLPSTL